MSKRARPSGVEYRALNVGEVGSSDGRITGLAAPFDSPTMIGDPSYGFRESFAPGAFTKTLAESDVVFLYNHNTDMPIARKSAGTLSLQQSERGLEYEAQPADTSYARDLAENIRAGNIQGNSFGFMAVKEDWLDDAGNPANCWDGTQRVVREAKLFEVSACTFPAYGDTDISMRDVVSAARERRAKYNAEQLKQMLAKGEAFKNADGEPSYPIADAEDLSNAIHAVGRGGADHDAIRKYIISRAKALGLSSKIPGDWNSDGSVTEQNSAAHQGTESRDDPDGKEYAVIDEAVTLLQAGKADQALRALEAEQASRSADPKPDVSTSGDTGFDYALLHELYARKPQD